MSMPGFVFHFRCVACDAASQDYPIFPFSDIFRADILLPAWSREHRCWAAIHLTLNSDQRTELETDAERMISFARSLSSPAFTVCVPSLRVSHGECCEVLVTPEPICPHCGAMSQPIFGYPSCEAKRTITDFPPEEIDAIPLSALDLSVRTWNLCSELNILTIGQLRNQRDSVVHHKQATNSTIEEIDRLTTIVTEKNK